MRLSTWMTLAPAIVVAIASPAFSQSGFYGQDRNGDGVVTRDEWRGNDQSFRQRDSNDDGVLSGNELPASMRSRRQTQRSSGDQNRYDDRNANYGDQRSNGDRNRYGDQDRNNDGNGYGRGSNDYGRNEGNRNRSAARTGQNATLEQLDKNRSGVVEGNEWPFNADVFHELDRNGDSVLSSEELRNTSPETLRNRNVNGTGRRNQ